MERGDEDEGIEELFAELTRRRAKLDGYILCGPGCSAPHPTTGACGTNACATGCGCHLFARAKGDPPQDPGSWKHKAKPGIPHAPIAGQVYRCFCVKPA
jgi:hypothetical protein